MNNEPVAWMYKDKESGMVSFLKETLPFDAIPLYTHPLQKPTMILDGNRVYPCLKELTDEEITAISKEIFKDYKNFHHYQIDFARAILRKAQELTDDEIDKIAKKCDEDEEQGKTHEFWYRNFARAILRKAQEK